MGNGKQRKSRLGNRSKRTSVEPREGPLAEEVMAEMLCEANSIELPKNNMSNKRKSELINKILEIDGVAEQLRFENRAKIVQTYIKNIVIAKSRNKTPWNAWKKGFQKIK